MDVLTEVLREGMSRTAIYGRLELSAPWGLRVDGTRRLSFYAVARGAAVLEVRGKKIQLGAGDLVFLQKGLAHTLKDHARSRAASVNAVYAQRGGRCGGVIQYGGGGAPVTIISGGFEFDTTALNPLVAHLPEVIHVPGDMGDVVRWLESTLHLMAFEMHTEEPGYELVASRIADVLFVHALRSHVNNNPCQVGWLRAIGDARLGAAFRCMHEAPAEPWTVEKLARTASMSRAAFAARFTELLGLTPLAYLTRWRMHRAAELLAVETSNISAIAASVGYETESAFSKVFKRHFGETPGAYRRRLRSA
ncbi:AraC family transcriptional regulator [Corallococcus silvisoli]|uniref:AraC family transcriptional regulator n=1 Tax=Corallococcus silvisoli TaxID=2697031 RepID=UPI0013770C28|nr:AraC family transcriptional regulator [Corallococcus silvisoli]NBD12358.1 helix-turn-helix domain-containing protein [Corallococcus silvisoli]